MMKIVSRIKRKAQEKIGKITRGLASISAGPGGVKVGFPAGKVEPGIVQRAVWNEFGTRGSGKGFSRKGKGGKVMGGFGGPIPERPFMRNTLRANRAKYDAALASGARSVLVAIIRGKDVKEAKHKVLSKVGALAQGDIQKEITSLRTPPNAPLTIALKGSSNPLIDSGEMRQRVTFQVED